MQGDHTQATELLKTHPQAKIDYLDSRGYGPIHCASRLTSESLGMILKHGANPNLRSRFQDCPLHMAASHGLLENTKLLLDWGASASITFDNACNALHT